MTTASYHGVHYTVIDNLPAVASFLPATEWGGNVKAVTDVFTATAGDTGTSGSFIYIGKIPKNSIPLGVTISTPAAITWTGTIGWSGNEDALGDFPAQTVAGSKVCGTGATEQTAPLTAAKDIYVLTGTATIVDGDSITTTIFYIQAG